MCELLLVGGGHAHAQVLRSLLMKPLAGVHVTLVVDDPIAVYSGMVPGVVAGLYRPEDVELDVRPLARRAGASVVVARALRVLPGASSIELEGRAPLRYDVASLNVGSTVAGVDTPGVREHAIATRPIARFVARLEEAVARARAASRPLRAVVVGAGAAGVELAFGLDARLAREGIRGSVTLVEGGARILPERGERLRARALAALERRGIVLVLGARVAAVREGGLDLAGRAPLEADLVLWAAGAAPPAVLERSELPKDARGFVRVGPTLEVVGAPRLFAVGDAASLETWPEIPKAGVYAVREGPVLARNLRALATGRPLARYEPQRDFLALLNLGDGTALGEKWGLAFEGSAVFALKDRIDRRFLARFRVLDAPAPMTSAAMPCGGCAAKASALALRRALERLPERQDPDVVLGLATPDDVAAVRRPGEVVVASVDAFPAFTDDPWLVGRVAAVNALSDLEAKGARARFALALVTLPRGVDEAEVLFQVLAGARATLDAANVSLVGGHTTVGSELTVGFSVTGFAPDPSSLSRKGGLRAGERIVLSRALGTGVLWRADGLGLARGRWVEAATRSMLRGNGRAGEIARRVGASAVTDVTGFGLAGHLAEMLRASGVRAELDLAKLPALPGALELFARGVRSTFHDANRAALGRVRGVATDPRAELLFDPQTAGGLLFGVASERADEAVSLLREAGEDAAAVIGRVLDDAGGAAPLIAVL